MFVPVGFLFGLKMYLILVGVLVLVLCNNIHWKTCTDSSDLWLFYLWFSRGGEFMKCFGVLQIGLKNWVTGADKSSWVRRMETYIYLGLAVFRTCCLVISYRSAHLFSWFLFFFWVPQLLPSILLDFCMEAWLKYCTPPNTEKLHLLLAGNTPLPEAPWGSQWGLFLRANKVGQENPRQN